MRFLCKVGIHSYTICFIPFDDQPFLTDNLEDDLCGVEGRMVEKCKHCGKEVKMYDRKY